MSKLLLKCLLPLSLGLGSIAAMADDHPYTDGPVLDITRVRTKPGMFDEYVKFLAGPWKQIMEEQKKAGLLLDYYIYSATPRSPNDPDMYIVSVYKNWAAFDGYREKDDPIEKKVWGSLDASNKAYMDRDKMREILGDEFIQEVKLK